MSEETIIAAGPFSRIAPGHRLNEIYEIDSLLATGGMGEVYRGHAIETGDQVAIKTIRPEFAQNTAALALFKKEATALRNLYHEAIVRYFVFSIDKGLPYLAMEYVEGKSLSDFLQKGPLTVEQLRVLQKRLASGLHAAHELGIIHRDVSPDNVILPGENLARAKIIDFGIARSTQGEATVIGSGFAGKFSYVSPEQLGLYGGDVTGKSDIYSLGLVLAEAALGKAIDMGHSHVDVIDKRRRIPDLSGIDAKFRPLLTWMLQPDPKDRPASMAEVAEWVPSGKMRTSAGASGSGSGKKGGLIAIAAVLVLAALGGGAFMFVPQLRDMLPGGDGAQTSSAITAPSTNQAALPNVPAPAPSSSQARTDSTPSSDALLPSTPPPPARTETAALPPPGRIETPPAAEPPPVTPTATAPSASVPPASTPSVEPTVPGGRATPSIEQVAAYLRDYKGGECFFVAPVQLASREAKIEAFGAAPAPFMAFDDAFQKSMGFEPEISLRQVTAAQCPIVDVLAQKTSQRGHRAPRLTLRSDRIRSGQELVGTVDARADANVEVLLVADDGLVHNLGPYLKRSGDSATFTLRLEASGSGEKPQLVIAIASPRLVGALKITGPVSADRFARQLAEETARGGISGVAARYFKLGG